MQPGSKRRLRKMPAKRPPPMAAVREYIRPSPCSGVNRIPWRNDSDSADIAQTDAAPSPGHRGQARHDDQLCRLRRRQAPGRHCHRRTAPRAGQQRGIRLDCAEGPGTDRDPDAAGDPGPARTGGGGHAARRPALQGRGIRPDAVRHDEGGRAVRRRDPLRRSLHLRQFALRALHPQQRPARFLGCAGPCRTRSGAAAAGAHLRAVCAD